MRLENFTFCFVECAAHGAVRGTKRQKKSFKFKDFETFLRTYSFVGKARQGFSDSLTPRAKMARGVYLMGCIFCRERSLGR